MSNIMEMTINEIRMTYLNLFPSVSEKYLESIPLTDIMAEIEEEEKRISDIILNEEDLSKLKHSPSKKKKANRVNKARKSTFVKQKSKWKIPTTKPIEDDTTNNRSYLKRKYAGYIKLKPQKSL